MEVKTHKTHPGTSCNKSKPKTPTTFYSADILAFGNYYYITWKLQEQNYTVKLNGKLNKPALKRKETVLQQAKNLGLMVRLASGGVKEVPGMDKAGPELSTHYHI